MASPSSPIGMMSIMRDFMSINLSVSFPTRQFATHFGFDFPALRRDEVGVAAILAI